MDETLKRERFEENNHSDSGGSVCDALPFFTSGCPLLDCVLGGGWAEGRLINIVGDNSSGKTLLAMEALMGFQEKYPNGLAYYDESEAAFDDAYMESLGVRLENVVRVEDTFTVEDLFRRLDSVVKEHSDQPGLYILDSLDALSSESELKRKIDEGSYRMEKAKQLSELFRRLNKQLSNGNVTVIFVSQTRDNISVTFGEKSTRSGGKSLNFYASQILWLSQTGKIPKTLEGVKRIVGVKIRARCKKNKCGPPFRECNFPIRFFYGIDDVTAGLDWLEEIGSLGEKEKKGLIKQASSMEWDEFNDFRRNISDRIRQEWSRIETTFLPKRKKYQ